MKLLAVSFLSLFLELALVRWVGTEVRIFAYFNNLVLLACFLGLGAGCALARRRAHLGVTLAALGALLFSISLPISFEVAGSAVHPVRDAPLLLSAFADSLVWYPTAAEHVLEKTLWGLGSVLFVFALIFACFVPVGQVLGRLLEEAKSPVRAYSLNVAASLAGIAAFSGLAFIEAPPLVWFALCLVLLVLLLPLKRLPAWELAAAVFCTIAVWQTQPRPAPGGQLVWSPYQKLDLRPGKPAYPSGPTQYVLEVNSARYMSLSDLSTRARASHEKDKDALSQYDLPYLFKKAPERVLIVGAGAGNDVAGALRGGAAHVDAVEIDPAIQRLGAEFHPERPYGDPRVRVTIDDARSFFKRTRERYDLICFGLLDAHGTSSQYNNMRIDHYVYTRESFQEARALLKPGGVMTVAFEAQRPWIAQRLRGNLREAFGDEPLVFKVPFGRLGWGGSVFVAGFPIEGLARDPALARFAAGHPPEAASPATVAPTTDDWPYLYLERRAVPKLFLAVLGVLALLILATGGFLVPAGFRLDRRLFFLGAGFLLLEFQNISRTMLFFGSTWLVNTITIAAILALILLANLGVERLRWRKTVPFYAGLGLSLLASALAPATGWTGVLLLNLPLFFASAIFTISFRDTREKDAGFASNLLGAAVGGMLETASFVVGIRWTLALAAGLYALSFRRE